jgi:hypothetical protein
MDKETFLAIFLGIAVTIWILIYAEKKRQLRITREQKRRRLLHAFKKGMLSYAKRTRKIRKLYIVAAESEGGERSSFYNPRDEVTILKIIEEREDIILQRTKILSIDVSAERYIKSRIDALPIKDDGYVDP